MKELDCCMICPRSCGVNRNAGETGYCGSDNLYHIGSICIHHGEEPAISGKKGICNVFFTGCNLQCLYCQNYQISHTGRERVDKALTLDEVIESIIHLLNQGIEAVGFVTPTHFTPHVKTIIAMLNQRGYHPITVYNTNAYDSPQVIRTFEGLIDVYLPDFKYFDPALAAAFSGAGDYPKVAREVLKEMYRQKGSTVVLNNEGQAVTGLIIRHLVLPGQVKDSVNILKWIAETLSPSITISLMSQYYPTACVAGHPLLGRQITAAEYHQVSDAMEELGFHKGWIQDFNSAENYRPDFSRESPFEDA
ncbi:MAG: radical SAM protein [Bacteroidales bacterium]|nr:radical SAM protein [Bacteroidales bacterium]